MKYFALLFLLPLSLLGQTVGTGNIVIGFGPAAPVGPTLIMTDYMLNGTTSDSGFEDIAVAANWGFTPAMQGSFSLYLTAPSGEVRYNFSPSTYTEIWVVRQRTLTAAASVGATTIEFSGSGGELIQIDNWTAGAMHLSKNGGTDQTTAGIPATATVIYEWIHWNSTGAADYEFETTPTRIGSGSNFIHITDAGTTSFSQLYFFASSTSGKDEQLDSIKVSAVGWPIFP